jgi:hypothetical protein
MHQLFTEEKRENQLPLSCKLAFGLRSHCNTSTVHMRQLFFCVLKMAAVVGDSLSSTMGATLEEDVTNVMHPDHDISERAG